MYLRLLVSSQNIDLSSTLLHSVSPPSFPFKSSIPSRQPGPVSETFGIPFQPLVHPVLTPCLQIPPRPPREGMPSALTITTVENWSSEDDFHRPCLPISNPRVMCYSLLIRRRRILVDILVTNRQGFIGSCPQRRGFQWQQGETQVLARDHSSQQRLLGLFSSHLRSLLLLSSRETMLLGLTSDQPIALHQQREKKLGARGCDSRARWRNWQFQGRRHRHRPSTRTPGARVHPHDVTWTSEATGHHSGS